MLEIVNLKCRDYILVFFYSYIYILLGFLFEKGIVDYFVCWYYYF